ncbi:hypothetical protein DN402_01230 [Streptomyces sp. SW4]|nr:hypothetical protein DN402_01230 [Streptomyces sp. SW4]
MVQKKGSKGKKRVHVVRRYTEFDGKYTWHVTVWSNGKVTKWKERATIVRPSPPGPVTPDEPDNAEQGSAA